MLLFDTVDVFQTSHILQRDTHNAYSMEHMSTFSSRSNATSKERSSIQCAGCDDIQKGESEFEMESEDSDTALSEEEADEDACGQVDKENQQPNDRPVSDYVDIEPQPNKHTKPRDSEISCPGSVESKRSEEVVMDELATLRHLSLLCKTKDTGSLT
ncbi:hypothetical protein NQZ68_017503 [Dissostichus eleginoides]|nr:hypothetical protein NQZ68_017503 [Dissostichus eleginoides]